MTFKEHEMLQDTRKAVKAAREKLAEAQEILEQAAEKCGPMKDRLYSVWDDIESLRFDLDKETKDFADRLRNGGAAPASWKEAI